MDLTRLDQEETLLVARFEDLARAASKNGRRAFSGFLNERQQLLAEEAIRQRKLEGCVFSGGYGDAVRRMLGFFPQWERPDPEEFPLEAVTIRLPKSAEPSHRDVLGSLMSMRVARESIGDILLNHGERRCDVFVLRTVAPLLVDELTRIGGYGVRCETGAPGDYRREEQFLELRGTVGSLRIDALVSMLTGLAREKGADLLRSEQVRRNYQIANNTSGGFSSGDVISIRGYGKYKVDEIGKPTKKGRLPVLCRKFI